MGLWDEIKRILTNTKTPSKTRLFLTILFVIASPVAGYFFNEFMDSYRAHPDIYFDKVQPYLESDYFGTYLPMHFTNVGDKDLEEAQISVKTCYMDLYEPMTISETIPKHSSAHLIKFTNKETIHQLEAGICNSRPKDKPACNITYYTYQNITFAPMQNCTFYSCSLCKYEVIMSGKNYRDNKSDTFWGTFRYTYLAGSVKDTASFEPIFPEESRLDWMYNTSISIDMTGQNEQCLTSGDPNCEKKSGFMNWEYVYDIDSYPKDVNFKSVTLKQKYPNDIDYIQELQKRDYIVR